MSHPQLPIKLWAACEVSGLSAEDTPLHVNTLRIITVCFIVPSVFLKLFCSCLKWPIKFSGLRWFHSPAVWTLVAVCESFLVFIANELHAEKQQRAKRSSVTFQHFTLSVQFIRNTCSDWCSLTVLWWILLHGGHCSVCADSALQSFCRMQFVLLLNCQVFLIFCPPQFYQWG